MSSDREDKEQESVLESIERRSGSKSRILLRALRDEEAPVVQVRRDGDAEAGDDARHQILGEIARGGVGIVFQGRDRDLGRDVALKVLRPEFAGRADVVDRFIEEAQVGGQLQHPGVVPVYAIGLQSDGRPYFTMKLVKGRTLAALLAGRSEPDEDRTRLLQIFEQLCQAVAYAHDRGVIHRDLKPANVMIGAFGEVQLMDWGFAKVLDADSDEDSRAPLSEQSLIATVRTGGEGSHSIAGSVMGTPAYMPPEQALGRVNDLDERADVFALGAILCEILTGDPPYVGEPNDRIVAAAQGKVEDAFLRLDDSSAEADLVRLTESCLAPTPSERPRDAGVIARAMARRQAEAAERARRVEIEAAEARAEAERSEVRAVGERDRAEAERDAEERERRKADWERGARRRALGAAIALLVAVAVGGGALLNARANRQQRRSVADGRIRAAVEEARELQGEERWSEAVLALDGALDIAGNLRSAVREQAEGLLSELRRLDDEAKHEEEMARRDAALLASIEELSIRSTEQFDAEAYRRELLPMFQGYGVDLEALEPERAAERLRSRPIAADLASWLFDWALMERMTTVGDERWRRIAEVARLTEPDPSRRKLLEAAIDRDRAVLLRSAADAAVADLPSPTIRTIARELAMVGGLKEATSLLERAYRAHPGDLWINLYLSTFGAISGANKPEESLRHQEAAVAIRPDSVVLRLMLGNLYGLIGKQDLQFAHLREAVRRWPDSTDAWQHLGMALAESGEFEEAIESFQSALPLEPKRPLFYAVYGDTLLKIARREEAIEAFVEGALREPRLPYYGMIARALGVPETPESLARAYRAVLARDPEHAETHKLLGQHLMATDEYAEGLRSLRKAADGLPDDTLAQNNLAWHLANCADESFRDPKEAVRRAKRATDLTPKLATVWNTLGAALCRAGEHDEAVSALERSLELGSPSPAYDWLFLAMAHAERGDAERAGECWRKANRIIGNGVTVIDAELERIRAEVKARIGK